MNKSGKPKIGIVCATSREALMIVNPRQLGMNQIERDPFRIYIGEDLAMIITGMRRECASLGLRHFLNCFPSVEEVVNIGVGGSLDNNIFPIGTVVLAGSVQSHDHDEEKIIQLIQSIEKLKTKSGLKIAKVLTGNEFVSLNSGAPKLEQLNTLGDVVEMEAFWVAKECEKRGVKLHVVKAISDEIFHPDPISHLIDFSKNANFAAGKAKPILREIIKIIRA